MKPKLLFTARKRVVRTSLVVQVIALILGFILVYTQKDQCVPIATPQVSSDTTSRAADAIIDIAGKLIRPGQ